MHWMFAKQFVKRFRLTGLTRSVFKQLVPISFIAGLFVSGGATADLLDPAITIGGHSQHTLADQWWAWALPISPLVNPLLDSTGAQGFRGDAGVRGDPGSAFFLAGSVTGASIIRTVTVPHSTPLFFPIINTVFDNTVPISDPLSPPTSLTAQQMLDLVAPLFDPTKVSLFLELDGVAVDPAKLLGLRQTTDANAPFTYTVTSADTLTTFFCCDGTLGTGVFPHTVSPVITDGYWAALSGLAPGSALSLHFGGTDAKGNRQDDTYILRATSVPAPSPLLLIGIGLTALVARRRRTQNSHGARLEDSRSFGLL